MDFSNLVELFNGDPTVCYFFLIPKKIPGLEKTRKRIKKAIKMFTHKYIHLEINEFRDLTIENIRFLSPIFLENFIYPIETTIPLTFILINNLEQFSFENQQALKHYLDNGWDNLRYIFTGRILDKISPVILSRCLFLKIGGSFKKICFVKKNNLSDFFLQQSFMFKKESVKKNFWYFLDKKKIFGSLFCLKLVENFRKTGKLPNEIFFFFIEPLEKSKLAGKSYKNDVFFPQKYLNFFFSEILEYFLLAPKHFKTKFKF